MKHLTRRQDQIIYLIATGSTDKAIADKLRISESTVSFHASSIMRKLHASSRAHAVMIRFIKSGVKIGF
jgi:DNA-binding NarL/FixJ family response regulator